MVGLIAASAGVGLIVAGVGVLLFRSPGPRWREPNRRGVLLPVTLGWALALGVASTAYVVWRQQGDLGLRDSQAGELLGAAIVLAAGVLDDGLGGEVRGLRGHLRALKNGRFTTGSLKIAAAILAAAITVAWTPRTSTWANLLALLTIAGCTNVWNGLDVAPGRAVKAFLVVAVVLLVVDAKAFLAICTGAAAAILFPDVRERGMLGDAGANLLGFLAGAEIVRRLPEAWLPAAAAVVIGLNLLAETFTFTRTIEAIPPLRWFDRLGRVAEPTS
jgi:hypothetical protein